LLKKRGRQKRKKSLPFQEEVNIEVADAVFSRWIRTRDDYTCVLCGSKIRPQCGHLVKRGKNYVRFDEFNCNCQCANCNQYHNYYPERYTIWFIERYGFAKYKELVNEAMKLPTKKTFTKSELKAIIDKYNIPPDKSPS
jgi:hypothetical protein